jgi:uncharacterized protein (DUF362 family)
MSPRVFIDRLQPDAKNYLDLIGRGLADIRFGEHVSSSTRVFIKPNLTFPHYEPGVMTSPDAVQAAILAIRDYTPHVSLGDADSGGYNRFNMDEVYEKTGVKRFADENGARVVNLSSLPRRNVALQCGSKTIEVDLPRLLLDEVDVFITMPVPKIHMNSGVSLTYKNQWGCIPEPQDRLRLHPYFTKVVIALNEVLNTRFAIVDGRFGLNRSGPMRGDVVDLNWVLVGDDIGAAARVLCRLMQVELARIPHLKYAEKLGLVPPMSQIDVNQDVKPFIQDKFYLKRQWTDLPGYLAFKNRYLAHLAYFSRLADPLHRLLYRFREPFYDYEEARASVERSSDGTSHAGKSDSDGSSTSKGEGR